MIGVANPLPPLCTACGTRIDYEPEDATGLACNDCFADSERKAAEENIRDFRWCARNWLRCDGCKGTGEHNESYCYCRIGQAMHDAEAAQFEFVRYLPAGSVLNARYMLENDIDPQERIAK